MVKFIKNCRISYDGVTIVNYSKGQKIELSSVAMEKLKGNYEKVATRKKAVKKHADNS